ncbi:hypothetical protein ACFY0G_10445 [Streptomyces sp. NPDC001552]|uniref:hypothetical protein n=1 Tax=Streptomyces sp. NPDC001552 TaxID=3364587 RepID=UPI0036C93684
MTSNLLEALPIDGDLSTVRHAGSPIGVVRRQAVWLVPDRRPDACSPKAEPNSSAAADGRCRERSDPREAAMTERLTFAAHA